MRPGGDDSDVNDALGLNWSGFVERNLFCSVSMNGLKSVLRGAQGCNRIHEDVSIQAVSEVGINYALHQTHKFV